MDMRIKKNPKVKNGKHSYSCYKSYKGFQVDWRKYKPLQELECLGCGYMFHVVLPKFKDFMYCKACANQEDTSPGPHLTSATIKYNPMFHFAQGNIDNKLATLPWRKVDKRVLTYYADRKLSLEEIEEVMEFEDIGEVGTKQFKMKIPTDWYIPELFSRRIGAYLENKKSKE